VGLTLGSSGDGLTQRQWNTLKRDRLGMRRIADVDCHIVCMAYCNCVCCSDGDQPATDDDDDYDKDDCLWSDTEFDIEEPVRCVTVLAAIILHLFEYNLGSEKSGKPERHKRIWGSPGKLFFNLSFMVQYKAI